MGNANEILKKSVKYLKENDKSTSLDLSFKRIGDAGAKDIAEALKSNKYLTKLYLYNNNIGDSGAKEFVVALRSNKCLTELYIYNNECQQNLSPIINPLLQKKIHIILQAQSL